MDEGLDTANRGWLWGSMLHSRYHCRVLLCMYARSSHTPPPLAPASRVLKVLWCGGVEGKAIEDSHCVGRQGAETSEQEFSPCMHHEERKKADVVRNLNASRTSCPTAMAACSHQNVSLSCRVERVARARQGERY